MAEHRRPHPDIPMTNDGRVIVRNHSEKRRIMKRLGFYNEDSYCWPPWKLAAMPAILPQMPIAPFMREIATFAEMVRESTLKRLRQVQVPDRGWRHRPELLSFSDVLKHLIDADRWCLAIWDGRSAQRAVVAPGDGDPAQWNSMFAALVALGTERATRIQNLQPEEMVSRTFDLGPDGKVSLASLILRCNLDHEIHHRGALQLALRLRYASDAC